VKSYWFAAVVDHEIDAGIVLYHHVDIRANSVRPQVAAPRNKRNQLLGISQHRKAVARNCTSRDKPRDK